MASNLRVEFHERQHKHLSESIAINLSPSKKAYPKPAPNPPSKSAPWTTIVAVISEMDEKPSFVDDISYHKIRKPFIILGEISEDSFECLNTSPLCPKTTYVPNREEISKLLSCISSFTESELLVSNMGVLFPAMQRILVKVDENFIQSLMAWLLYSTPYASIDCILHTKDYTTFEIAKVVLLVTFLVFPLVSRLIIISIVPRWYPEFITSCDNKRTFSSD